MQNRSTFLTKNKALMLSFAVSSALALTSCATVTVLDQLDHSSPSKTLISDSLIAYGYAKTPIPQHENALILVGKKYNYLIEADQSESNNSILKDTVMQLDLKALSIMPEGMRESTYFEIYEKNQKETFHERLRIEFNKPLSQVSKKEKLSLEQLNFNCFANTARQSYECFRIVNYTLSPIKKTNQDSQLQYTFKSPMSLQVKTNRSKALDTLSKAPYVLLLPITVVVDIVTLPIQYFALSKSLSQGQH